MSFTLSQDPSDFQRMGNLVDSDSCISVEVDRREAIVGVPTHKQEVRTEGDGMESEDDRKRVPQTGLDQVPSSLDCIKNLSAEPVFNELNLNKLVKQEFQGKKLLGLPKLFTRQIESPKELPPKSQLISFNPVRISEKRIEVAEHSEKSNSIYRFNNSPVLKQKNPKFVPYEPYKGAVRSMTDESFKTHSRKGSAGSSTSGYEPRFNATPLEGLNQNTSALHLQDTLKFQSPVVHLNNIVDSDRSPRHSQNHSETLLRERLKIQDKDISELQCENGRLKKLLVDSMSGSKQVLKTHEMGLDPFSRSPHFNSISESFDNSKIEIEVWRSKFLSSCVLVEQLQNENRVLKENDKAASQIFKDVKNNTTLTPEIFEQINYWLHHRSSFKAEFFRGGDNDLENDG